MAQNQNKSTLGLVLGILSLILWLLPILGLPISIIGLVLGIKGLKEKKKYATAAIVCSIIGLILAIANGVLGAYINVMNAIGK